MFSLIEYIPYTNVNKNVIDKYIENAEWCNNISLKKYTLNLLRKQKNYKLDNTQITITPISQDIKSKSNINYKEQLSKSNWYWDEASPSCNKLSPKIGQLFGFYFPKKKMIIHRVIDILSPIHRLPTWSLNVGQSNRQVLKLSEPLKEFTFEEWCLIEGHKKQQGTFTSNLDIWKNGRLKIHLKNIK